MEGVSWQSQFLATRLASRTSEYAVVHKQVVRAVTYNVNGKALTGAVCSSILCPATGPTPSLVIVGLQETDLSASTLLSTNSDASKKVAQAVRALGVAASDAGLVLVSTTALVGIVLAIFSQPSTAADISPIIGESIPVGVMGVLGNKGAVSVSLAWGDAQLGIVATHLAAHTEQLDRRTADVAAILDQARFVRRSVDDGNGDSYGEMSECPWQDMDAILWLGDLNYRVEMPYADALAHLEEGSLDPLLARDQLSMVRAAGVSFAPDDGWCEAPITFPPSYKFDVGTTRYDTSEKRRTPSWTDRVLWWQPLANGMPRIECLRYERLQSLVSDHWPVAATLALPVFEYDTDAKLNVLATIHQELDAAENAALPDASLEPRHVQMGPVRLHSGSPPERRTLTLTNTSTVPFQWCFSVGDTFSESVAATLSTSSAGITSSAAGGIAVTPWLRCTPSRGFLMPDSSTTIVISTHLTPTLYADLARDAFASPSGRHPLQDTLILRLHSGKDLFIAVDGTVEASFYGAHLDALTATRGPVRPNGRARSGTESSRSRQQPIAKEVWVLVDRLLREPDGGLQWLLRAANAQEEEDPQLGAHMAQLAAALDTMGTAGLEEVQPTPLVVAATLLGWLGALPEPLLPLAHYSEALAAAPTAARAYEVVQYASPVAWRAWFYLTGYLSHTLRVARADTPTRHAALGIFADLMVRSPTRPDGRLRTQSPAEAGRRAEFLAHFVPK